MARRALLTGIAGQDGWYLTKLLVEKGYEVTGCDRPGSLTGPRGMGLRNLGANLVDADLLDGSETRKVVAELRPDEVYNLAGNSFVPQSWEDPVAAARVNTWPVVHLMEAIRQGAPKARLFQASTSEIFGSTDVSPQDEGTPVAPANPYAAAKVFAHHMVQLYRRQYGLFVTAGILYNHESPRRPPTFVTAKICHAVKAIKAGRLKELQLGDLDTMRDWGFAGDFVDAMWRMLQQEEPADYVIGTGVPHTVRDICRLAFSQVGLDYGDFVKQDPAFMRFGQPSRLLANPAKAKHRLGWEPGTSFEDLVHMMVDAAPD